MKPSDFNPSPFPIASSVGLFVTLTAPNSDKGSTPRDGTQRIVLILSKTSHNLYDSRFAKDSRRGKQRKEVVLEGLEPLGLELWSHRLGSLLLRTVEIV